MRKVDITGQRFARLIVKKMVREPGQQAKAECLCDCGGSIIALAYNLKSGNTKSCGCLAREHSSEQGKRMIQKVIAARRRHGMSRTPTYAAWLDARKRCYRPRDTHFHLYGGRGIQMCPEWRDSFDAFLRDMGERPVGMTLERKDVDGNYEPTNCRWATKGEQARNKRRNVATWDSVAEIRATYGKGVTGKELARRLGMSKSNVFMIASGATWPESERPKESVHG